MTGHRAEHDHPTHPEVEQLREEVDELRECITELVDRVATLEDSGTRSTLPPGASDWRDARVLEDLEPGTVITTAQFRQLIRSNTDITDDNTITERMECLTSTDAFEKAHTKHNFRWRYLGDT